MSSWTLAWAWKQQLPPEPKLALIYISDNAAPFETGDPDHEGGFTVSRLAAFVGCTVERAEQIVQALVDQGLVQIHHVDGIDGPWSAKSFVSVTVWTNRGAQ